MFRLMRRMVVPLLLSCLIAGCSSGKSKATTTNDTDDSTGDPPTALLKLGGAWAGRYYLLYNEEDDEPIPLTATIRQDGNSLYITTTKEGVGHSFTGTVNSEGHLRVTDALDGELWTTHFGPARSDFIRLADYLYSDQLYEDSPYQIIDLYR